MFEVSKSLGDVANVPSAGCLSRSRQQAADARRSSMDKDPLFSLMHMCKESEGKGSQFIRVVTGAPEPMAILSFDWTLNDLVRFCTNKESFSTLGVDPTFNLGSFHITVTTYEHKMLHKIRTSLSVMSHPTMMGPLLIHQRKTFSTYHFFISRLVGLRPELRGVQAFGTDGEEALSNALGLEFPSAVHLRCFLHFKDNVKAKLMADLQIASHACQEFLSDIFGKPSAQQFGLVDAKSEDEFHSKMTSLKEVWNKRKSRETKSDPQFFDWFMVHVHCSNIIVKNMLRPVRTAAGLRSPPSPFYTNVVESLNKIAKLHTNYKKHQLPQFVEMIQQLYLAQEQEIEKALSGTGEYRVVPALQQHQYESRKWFSMSSKQRKAALKRFMSASCALASSTPDHLSSNLLQSSCSSSSCSSSSCSSSSCDINNPLASLSLPVYISDQLWSKACELSSGDICKAPGSECCWVVKSDCGKPYNVEKTSAFKFVCDVQRCMAYKSSHICAHTVAVARLINQLDFFLGWYKKNNQSANITALAQTGIPVGGKKPKRRKGVSKLQSSKIARLVEGAAESDWDDGPTSSLTNVTLSSSNQSNCVVLIQSPQQLYEPPYVPGMPPYSPLSRPTSSFPSSYVPSSPFATSSQVPSFLSSPFILCFILAANRSM